LIGEAESKETHAALGEFVEGEDWPMKVEQFKERMISYR
jgi:hypothetical protein